jgi:hypothetical protein
MRVRSDADAFGERGVPGLQQDNNTITVTLTIYLPFWDNDESIPKKIKGGG